MILARHLKKKKREGRDAIATRVLLVEDELLFQHLHFLMLEELGCCVDIAATGAQALANAVHPYDIIFMDIGLPDIRGTVVINKIRQSDLSTKNTPIIVLTAYNKNEIEEECFAAKASAVLSKPISSKTFKTVLRKYVTRR